APAISGLSTVVSGDMISGLSTGQTTTSLPMSGLCGNAGQRAAICAARCPAPYPLSMLTTPTPGAQLLSMVSRGAMPPAPAPYPTEVGTATTGQDTRPPTTLGRAPAMPAAMTTTPAACSSAS